MDEAHHLSPEKQRERYRLHENSGENTGYVEMFGQFIEFCVEPFVPKGSALLDFGCGPEPVLARLLAERGYSTDHFDPFFFPEGPLPKNYALITLTEVLEHLPDPLGTLRGLIPRLAPNGVLSIMTLFHPGDRDKFASWWYRRDATHVSFYSEETMERIARILGFDLLLTDSKRSVVLGKR